MQQGRYAAIDIGTVTCRMLVADVRGGRICPLAKEYAITNLGEGVDASGVLLPRAMQRVAEVIDRYVAVRNSLDVPGDPVRETVTVATSAARDAENADEFAALLAARGVSLSVIPGQREAALSFGGAASDFPGERILVVDIGGGSTEMIAGEASGGVEVSRSFDIGCRRVTERFFASDPPSADEIAAARSWIRSQFEPFWDEFLSPLSIERVVAVAGTATSVVSMREEMAVYDSERVHGAVVSKDELSALTRRLSAMPLDERCRVVGLDPGRAPVIVAGLVILEEVLRVAGAEDFTASESDILQGIVLDCARRG